MDIVRFKQVFDTLDEEGQKNVISQLTDDELSAINSFKPAALTATESEFKELPGNIPGSAARLIGGIAQAVASPVQTAKGIYNLTAGAQMKALDPLNVPDIPMPGLGITLRDVAKPALDVMRRIPEFGSSLINEDPETAVRTAEAVGSHFADRYGGLRNLKKTFIEDPVGFLADVSTVTGAGGAMTGSNVLRTVSRATDPLAQTAKAITSITSPVYKYTAGMTTTSGAKAIGDALKEAPGVIPAMRGSVTGGEVVEHTKDALQGIREARGAQYRSQLEGLKNAKQEIPIDDIKVLADEQLQRFNVKVTDEGLDFSRSTASGASAKEIDEVYKLVKDWGSKPGDLTPSMLDVLKRRLDDFYAEGRTSRAMVTTLKKAVQNKIVGAVPEYASMTKDYAKTSSIIQEIEKALSVGKRSAADTALRKLMVAAREDKSFRRDLIKILDDAGASNIEGSISGLSLNPIWSNRLGTYATAATGAGLAVVSPWLAGVMALASPRVVGEASLLFGRIGRVAKKARGTGLLAYQAGTVPLGTEAFDRGADDESYNRP